MLEGIPGDYLVWTPQLQLKKQKPGLGQGLYQVTQWAGGRTRVSHLLPWAPFSSSVFDHSAALGEALTPVWRGGLQVMGGSGCNSCWRLPFRSDTHHSFWAENPHSNTTGWARQTRWVIGVGRWWRVWFTGYPRRFGTLLFQPSRIRMTKLQRSDPVRLVLLNVAMPQLSCTLYFLHISLQRQLAEEIWLRELGRDVRETVQGVLSLLLWKKKSLNPIFFLPSFLCPSLPCNFHLSAQILFSVHYAPDGPPSRWC